MYYRCYITSPIIMMIYKSYNNKYQTCYNKEKTFLSFGCVKKFQKYQKEVHKTCSENPNSKIWTETTHTFIAYDLRKPKWKVTQ